MKTLFFLFIFVTGHADTFRVLEATGPGISNDERATYTELVRTYAQEGGNHQVVEVNAQHTLQPALLKVGGNYIVRLAKTSKDGKTYSSQLKAQRFEEIDSISRRLVRAVIDETTAASTVTTQDVTETEETAGTRRRQTVNRFYVGFGPGSSQNLNDDSMRFNWQIAYNFELQQAALKVYFEALGARASHFGIGGNYFFSDGDIAPVAGAWLGYGWSMIIEENNFLNLGETRAGFVLGGGAGVQFFRTSRINLEVLAHYSRFLVSNKIGAPGIYGVRVGLYF